MGIDFIGDRISKLRSRKGVSQRDMSLSIGQSVGYINRIENKNALPSIPLLFYICDYLGVSLTDFFDTSIEEPALVSELHEETKSLNEQALRYMLGIAKELNKK